MANDTIRRKPLQVFFLRLALLPLDVKIWMVTALVWSLAVLTIFVVFDPFEAQRWRALEWEKFFTILLLPALVSGLAISGYRWAIRTSRPDVRTRLASQYRDLRPSKQVTAASNVSGGGTERQILVAIPSDLYQAFESNDTTPEMQEHIKARVMALAGELADNLMRVKGNVFMEMVSNSADEFSRHGSSDPQKAFDDFVHAYLGAPEYAQQAAPRFFRDFDSFLQSELPDLYRIFYDTAGLYRKYANIVMSATSNASVQEANPRKRRGLPPSLLDLDKARTEL